MRRALLCTMAFVLLALPTLSRQRQSPNVVETDPLSPDKERTQFVLPPGFEAQLVAAEPDINKPMNIAFDDQGRLWVTDTLEYPFPVVKEGVKPRDTVKVLEDFAPDGKARKITTFADGLNIPIGVLPLPGASPRDALVFGIPNIWRLRDSLGKGVANQRTVAYGTYEFRDTHGMTNSFLHHLDGWVYACHGFSNRSEVKGSDGRAIAMQSGNTYRMKPDGSHLEQYTWGQVNPFGMASDPLGYFYTADCHSEPIYQLIRGGYYPSFGKPDDGLGFAPRMFREYKGSTAVCGIAYYDADAYPAAYRGMAYVGDVMTNQVVQFRIAWDGATPRATQHVLLQSKDQWFRPVDIKLGPDGALYVADFYNRIIGHYEVPLTHPGRDRHRGRIWRIVYTGSEAKATAARTDWTKASVKELVADLGHPNLTVRLNATHQLAKRGGKDATDAARAAAKDTTSTHAQAHALYALERLGALDDDSLKQAAVAKADSVRVHARRILAERPRWSAWERDLAIEGLKDASPHVRRASADAVGLHPDAVNLNPLIDLLEATPAKDTHLRHTARIALRNQLRPAASWKHVSDTSLSAKGIQAISDVARGVPTPESAAFLVGRVASATYPPLELTRLVQHIARHGDGMAISKLEKFAREHRPSDLTRQAALFRAVEAGTQQRGGMLSPEAREWGVGLTRKLLAAKDGGQLQLGIELARIARPAEAVPKLVELVRATTTPVAQRNAALDALFAIDAGKHAGLAGAVVADAALPIEAREHATRLLAQINQATTRALLLAALPTAPARLQNGIAAGLASSREGAESLFGAVTSGKASARLLQDRGVVLRLAFTGVPNLKERLDKLTAGLPAADEKVQKLLSARRKAFLGAKPEVARGAALFEKHCANCHQVGGKGAKVGPQLDGIGLRGLDRLLEDTLDPNRNVDEAFRTTKLVLTSGKTVEGLFLRQEGEVLVLADAQGKEVRVAKKDVEQRSVSPLSPMPANFVDQVSAADFNHLVAYLLSQKPSKP